MEKTQDLLIFLLRISAEINNKKIIDNRVQLLSLPRRIVNILQRDGCIVKDQLSEEQLLTCAGFLEADAYPQINHALIMVHPYDDMIVIKRYGNKAPEVIKIEYENEPGTND